MSKLLTLGILQQVQNSQGGEDGVLYDGEMTVGLYQITGTNTAYGWDAENAKGSIDPTQSGWGYCYANKVVVMSTTYAFYSNYPDIGSVLAHYEFGGTVYTTAQSLYTYLESEVDNIISLKVYEDAQ